MYKLLYACGRSRLGFLMFVASILDSVCSGRARVPRDDADTSYADLLSDVLRFFE